MWLVHIREVFNIEENKSPVLKEAKTEGSFFLLRFINGFFEKIGNVMHFSLDFK